KETMKEKLRKAFHEKRLGLPQSDPSVPLFVDHREESFGDHKNLGEDKLHKNAQSPTEQAVENISLGTQNIVIGSALKRGPDGELIMPLNVQSRWIQEILKKHCVVHSNLGKTRAE
ncbi:4208_t:CDS:2, partial [Acaulospora morrowiae]